MTSKPVLALNSTLSIVLESKTMLCDGGSRFNMDVEGEKRTARAFAIYRAYLDDLSLAFKGNSCALDPTGSVPKQVVVPL